MVEIDIPRDIQFYLEVPRPKDTRLIGDKPDYHFTLCFTHAVKAVFKGFKVTTSLEEYGSSCDICHNQMFNRQKEGLPETLRD